MNKISVIIPVYNAEKYLGACLESILNQTFQDFEVLVVDDCSTDNSAAIAENFLEKFGGRLKIIYLQQNSGSGAVPRNEGLRFSRGEYIFFMDNDDFIINTALEELYNFAEEYQADIVYMEQGFACHEKDGSEKLTKVFWTPPEFALNKIVMESNDISKRLEKFLNKEYSLTPWTKFLRRDFLISSKIDFPHVKIGEDVFWSFKVICLAENFLQIPNQLYVYRSRKTSWSQIERSPADEVKFWLDPLINGLNYLDNFMDESNFFAQNANYRFEVTNFFVTMLVAGMLGALKNLNRYQLYEILHDEFSGKNAALIANLFVVMNFYRDKFLEVR